MIEEHAKWKMRNEKWEQSYKLTEKYWLWKYWKPIDLLSVDLDQIVVSYKFKHNDESFKHFVGYLEKGIVKPLCIILPQMSEYIKYFENGSKNVFFY